MKRSFFSIITILFLFIAGNAQSGRPGIDKSPLDMSYYPANYPLLKIQDKATEPLVARVIYSRPQKEGRTIFGGLVGYGKVWRLGANEATEIEFYKPVIIGGKKIVAGRYTLYALVNEKTWTFIVNRENDTWGAFKYNQLKDIVRTDVAVEQTNEPVESLVMSFAKLNANTFRLIIEWENTRVALPISF